MKRLTSAEWRGIFSDVRALPAWFCLVLLCGLAAVGTIPLLERVWLNTDTRTIADNGVGATPATLTLVPKTSYVPITCSDGDGCTLTMSETSAKDGFTLTIENRGVNAITMSSSAGVVELQSALSLAQYQTIQLQYMSDRWVELGRSQPSTTCTLANPCRASVALTNAQIIALQTTYIQVVASPGSGKFINLLSGYVYIDPSAGAYTNVAADGNANQGITMAYGNWSVDAATFAPMVSTVNKLILHLVPFHRVPLATELAALYPPMTPTDNFVSIDNQPIKVVAWNAASGNYTGGNAANTGKAVAYYTVETIP